MYKMRDIFRNAQNHLVNKKRTTSFHSLKLYVVTLIRERNRAKRKFEIAGKEFVNCVRNKEEKKTRFD